jgi:hypothetical protein
MTAIDSITPAGVDALEQPGQTLCLQVAELRRFFLDGKFFNTCGARLPRPPTDDAFEVWLSDGARMKRCVLSTALNHLVYRGELRPLQLVRIASTVIFYNAELGNDAAQVMLTKVTPLDLDVGGALARRLADRPPALIAVKTRPADVPLVGARCYFLDLECNTVAQSCLLRTPTPEGGTSRLAPAADGGVGASADDEVDVDCFEQSLSVPARDAMHAPDLADALSWHRDSRAQRKRATPPPLVGRVVRCSSTPAHFGRAEDVPTFAPNTSCPFRFELFICDHSCDDFENPLPVVVWNRAALQQTRDVRVGDAVVVTNYKMKRRPDGGGAAAAAGGSGGGGGGGGGGSGGGGGGSSAGYEFEAAVNPVNPSGLVRIIPEADVRFCDRSLAVRLRLPPAPPALAASQVASEDGTGAVASGQDQVLTSGRLAVFGVLAHASPCVRLAHCLNDAGQPRALVKGRWLLLVTPAAAPHGSSGGAHAQGLRVWVEAHMAPQLFEALDVAERFAERASAEHAAAGRAHAVAGRTRVAAARARAHARSPVGNVVSVHEVVLVLTPAPAAAAQGQAADDAADSAGLPGPVLSVPARRVAYARCSQWTRVGWRRTLPREAAVMQLVCSCYDQPAETAVLLSRHQAEAAQLARSARCPAPLAWVIGSTPVDPSLPLEPQAWLVPPGEHPPHYSRTYVHKLREEVEDRVHCNEQRTVLVFARVHSLSALRPGEGEGPGPSSDGSGVQPICLRLVDARAQLEPAAANGRGGAGSGTVDSGPIDVRVPLAGGEDGARALRGLRALFGLPTDPAPGAGAEGEESSRDADEDAAARPKRRKQARAPAGLQSQQPLSNHAVSALADELHGRRGDFVLDLFFDGNQVARSLGRALLLAAQSHGRGI